MRGPNTKIAMNKYEEGISAAKKSYWELDDTIDSIQKQIQQTRQQLDTLKGQLSVAIQEEAEKT